MIFILCFDVENFVNNVICIFSFQSGTISYDIYIVFWSGKLCNNLICIFSFQSGTISYDIYSVFWSGKLCKQCNLYLQLSEWNNKLLCFDVENFVNNVICIFSFQSGTISYDIYIVFWCGTLCKQCNLYLQLSEWNNKRLTKQTKKSTWSVVGIWEILGGYGWFHSICG